MNEFPEEHVKVSSLEFVHFAHCQKFTGLPEVIEAENRTAMMNSKTNRTGNAACQQIVFESLWRSVFLLCRLLF